MFSTVAYQSRTNSTKCSSSPVLDSYPTLWDPGILVSRKLAKQPHKRSHPRRQASACAIHPTLAETIRTPSRTNSTWPSSSGRISFQGYRRNRRQSLFGGNGIHLNHFPSCGRRTTIAPPGFRYTAQAGSRILVVEVQIESHVLRGFRPTNMSRQSQPSQSSTGKVGRPRRSARIVSDDGEMTSVPEQATEDSISFHGAAQRAADQLNSDQSLSSEAGPLSFLGAAERRSVSGDANDQTQASIRGALARPGAESQSFEELMRTRPAPKAFTVVQQTVAPGAPVVSQEELRSVGLIVTGLGGTGRTAAQDFDKILGSVNVRLPFSLEITPGTDVKGAAEDYVFLRGGSFEQLELLATLLAKKFATGVEAHWIPMHGEDRSRQVSVEMKGTGEKGVEKLLKCLLKEKLEVVKHTYNKNSKWCYVVMRTRAMMEKVTATGNSLQIDATTLSPLASRVIIPQTPYEIIVTDCNQFQFPDELVLQYCSSFGAVYGIRRDGDNCLIAYRDYQAAAKAIAEWSLEDNHAGLMTGTPRLVYDHNVRNANVRLKSAGVSQRDIDNSSSRTSAQLLEVRQDLANCVGQVKALIDAGRKKDSMFMELMYKMQINQANINQKSAAVSQMLTGLQDEMQRLDRGIARRQMLILLDKCNKEEALTEMAAAEARIEELITERSKCNRELLTYVSNQVLPQRSLAAESAPEDMEMVCASPGLTNLSSQLLVNILCALSLFVSSFVSVSSRVTKSPLFRQTLILFCLSSVAAATFVQGPDGAAFHSFKIVTLNINGLGWVPKALAFQDALSSENPEAFILTENGSADSVNIVPWPNHRLFRTDGKPWRGSRQSVNLKKWGVVIGVRNDVPVLESAVNISGFRGRLAEVTVLIYGVPWDIWGIYAPAMTGGGDWVDDEDPVKFWSDFTSFITEKDSRNRQVFMGDFNVSISAAERSGGSDTALRDTREAYTRFLNCTRNFDLWQTMGDRHWTTDRTWHRGPSQGTIIDRCALGLDRRYLRNSIETKSYFLPHTDHRLVTCTLEATGRPQRVTTEFDSGGCSRRVTDPRKVSADRKRDFSYLVGCMWEDEMTALQVPLPLTIESREKFDIIYEALCTVINETATEVFQKRKRPRVGDRHASSAELRRLAKGVKTCGSMIRSISEDRNFSTSPALCVSEVLELYQEQSNVRSLLEFCKAQRTKWARERGKLQIKLDVDRAKYIDEAKMMSMINTGSIKRYVLQNDTPMNPPVLKVDGAYVTDADRIRTAHKEYIETLYAHEQITVHDGEKPWLNSDMSRQFKYQTSLNPFSWPQPVTTQDVEELCKRGNPRPTPGPDGMEKWCLKISPESIKSAVALLMHYAIKENYFPAKLKSVYVQMLFKKKDPLELTNYRTIMYSNAIANLIGTFFTLRLQKYAEAMGLLPQSQLATKQKVEMGDAASLICLANCARIRQGQPLYILNKDVAKGFDNQRPQAFYDALQFFGLPMSIRDFDVARQEDYAATILTAYGHAPEVRISGVTKQGDPPSPIKFCLAQAVGNHWIRECMAVRNATGTGGQYPILSITTEMHKKGRYHTAADQMQCEILDVVMMDDIAFLSHDVEALKFVNEVHEKFQWVGGATTSWAKSKLYVDEPRTLEDRVTSVDFFSTSIIDGRPAESSVTLKAETLKEQSFTGARLSTEKHHDDILESIVDFQFPYTKRYLPVQGVKKIVETCLVAKIRAKLQIQAVTRRQAAEIQMALIKRVCEYLGWRRCSGKFELLMREYRDGGMGWTSIVKLNEDAAIRRLLRDLRMPAERLQVLHQLARITISDLICGHLKCSSYISEVPCSDKWPTSWVVAIAALNDRGCRLQLNDMQSSETCSWGHMLRAEGNRLPRTQRESRHLRFFYEDPHLHNGPADFAGPLLEILLRKNIPIVQSVGTTMVAIRKHSRDDRVSWFWAQVSKTVTWQRLLTFHPKIAKDFAKSVQGRRDMLPPLKSQASRAHLAEREVSSWDVGLLSEETSNLIATDGSRMSRKSGVSVTSAATIAGRRMCARLHHGDPDSSHGEVFAVIMALLSVKANPYRKKEYLLLTDYKAVVDRVIKIRQGWQIEEGTLKGESYWKWLSQLVRDLDGMGVTVSFQHVKAHTELQDTNSRLNDEVDMLAKASHGAPVPIAPFPGFMTDVAVLDARGYSMDRDGYRGQDKNRMPSLYEETGLTRHKTTRGFTTKVLHEIKMGVYETRARRYDIQRYHFLDIATPTHGLNPLCDCGGYESVHHVFVACNLYDELKEGTQKDIMAVINAASVISKKEASGLEQYVVGLFRDSKLWPGGSCKYYMGRLPKVTVLAGSRNRHWVVKMIVSRCDNLVGRIAGARRKIRAENGEESRLAPRANDEWEELQHFHGGNGASGTDERSV